MDSWEWILLLIWLGLLAFVAYVLQKGEKHDRRISSLVKMRVRKRYGGECAVCPERYLLEFHHKTPFSQGGISNFENIVLLCPKHHRMIHKNEVIR